MMDLPVAHPWFAADDAGGGITRVTEPHVDPLLASNVWHVPGRDADLVVDAANGIAPLSPAIDALAEGRPVIAFATHGHFDHIGGLHGFADRRIHRADDVEARDPFPMRLLRGDFPAGTEEMFGHYDTPVPGCIVTAVPEPGFDVAGWVTPPAEATTLVDDGDVLHLGDRAFVVVHTPGHTAGSACLFEEATGTLFSGDAVYVDEKLSWDDAEGFAASLRRLRDLDVRIVHAGHDRSFDGEELIRTIDAQLRAMAG